MQNATVGTTMLQVRAIDGDTGVNGMVRYRFRQDLSGHWEAFHIHATTGVISLAKALDRQIQKIYHVSNGVSVIEALPKYKLNAPIFSRFAWRHMTWVQFRCLPIWTSRS